MKKFNFCLFIGLLMFSSCSEDDNTVDDNSMNLSFQDELDQELRAAISNHPEIGISVAVVFPDGSALKSTQGYSHLAAPINEDMFFDMGSAAKLIFSTIVLKIAEEGYLSLNDSLSEYFNPLPPFVDGTITIRQCLNMTSGMYMCRDHPASPFRNDFFDNDFNKYWTIEEIFNTVMNEPYFAPGQGWHYTQAGYQLGTLIVEQVMDQSVAEVGKQYILEPIGIEGFILDNQILPQML